MGFLFSGSLVSRQDAPRFIKDFSDRFKSYKIKGFSIVALGSLLLGFPLQNQVKF